MPKLDEKRCRESCVPGAVLRIQARVVKQHTAIASKEIGVA
jgi:hypothetical protein